MRTIKFRAKNEKGEWVYGSLLTWPDGKAMIYDTLLSDGSMGGHIVKPETIGQFTDVYDKNHQEIYDGDIVECVSWNEYFTNPATGEVMQPFRRKMYVDFRKGGFKMVEPMPEPMKDNNWDIIYNGDCEVIGNIHDNPKLIKRC